MIDNFLKLPNIFANNSSANISLSKAQLSKLSQKNSKKIQLDWFLGRFLGPLMTVGLPLMRNVINPLAKTFLLPLELAAASAADNGMHKNVFVQDVLWN